MKTLNRMFKLPENIKLHMFSQNAPLYLPWSNSLELPERNPAVGHDQFVLICSAG